MGTEMLLVAVRVRPPMTTVTVTGNEASKLTDTPVLVPANPKAIGRFSVPLPATVMGTLLLHVVEGKPYCPINGALWYVVVRWAAVVAAPLKEYTPKPRARPTGRLMPVGREIDTVTRAFSVTAPGPLVNVRMVGTVTSAWAVSALVPSRSRRLRREVEDAVKARPKVFTEATAAGAATAAAITGMDQAAPLTTARRECGLKTVTSLLIALLSLILSRRYDTRDAVQQPL